MNGSSKHTASRRHLLKSLAVGCGGMMTHTSVLSTMLTLQATKAAVADNGATNDYKALVCLFLGGGNDSFNMLVPRTQSEYDDYAASRGGYDDGNNNPGGLALSQSSLLEIDDPANMSGRSFGLAPGLGHDARLYDANGTLIDDGNKGVNGGIAKLYNDGQLAFLANVGALVEPTTRTEYNNRSNLPLGLFSHLDLTRHWQTGVPQSRSQITGWGGRLSDLLVSTNANPHVSMNISTNGGSLFLTGDQVVPYAIGTNGATQVAYYNESSLQNRMFSNCTDNLLNQTYSDLLRKTMAGTARTSIDAAVAFNTQVNAVQLTTAFDPDSLSQRFRKIAQIIGAQSSLEQGRQVFYISIGGFDNHADLLAAHPSLMQQVSRGLKSFYDATVELGCQNEVITFTASDFSRTLSSNGAGSDHAWGGNHMIMGGAVDGGKIFGDFPTSLVSPTSSFAGGLNLGRGRLLPTTSVDQLAAELAIWFGVDNATDLKMILPNIEAFYNYAPGQAPIGFLT